VLPQTPSHKGGLLLRAGGKGRRDEERGREGRRGKGRGEEVRASKLLKTLKRSTAPELAQVFL